MANDKKEYEAVLIALNTHAKAALTLNKLVRTVISTEDKALRNALASVDSELQRIVRTKAGSKQAFISAELSSAKQAIDYCRQQIALKEPQWQVLAKRAGWAPNESA